MIKTKVVKLIKNEMISQGINKIKRCKKKERKKERNLYRTNMVPPETHATHGLLKPFSSLTKWQCLWYLKRMINRPVHRVIFLQLLSLMNKVERVSYSWWYFLAHLFKKKKKWYISIQDHTGLVNLPQLHRTLNLYLMDSLVKPFIGLSNIYQEKN